MWGVVVIGGQYVELRHDKFWSDARADRGRAGLYLAGRNAALIGHRAAVRQGIGAGSGERAPLGIAARPVALHRLSERRWWPGGCDHLAGVTDCGAQRGAGAGGAAACRSPPGRC